MGSFYVSLSARADAATAFAHLVTQAHDTGLVAKSDTGWTACLSKALDSQDQQVINPYGQALSSQLKAPVLSVLNHDSSILAVDLFEDGDMVASYNSCPDYFEPDPSGKELPPTLQGLDRFAALVEGLTPAQVEEVLFQDAVFAEDIHHDLVGTLGLPAFTIGIGYVYAKAGESEVEWKPV